MQTRHHLRMRRSRLWGYDLRASVRGARVHGALAVRWLCVPVGWWRV
jgi:hypothetical protein